MASKPNMGYSSTQANEMLMGLPGAMAAMGKKAYMGLGNALEKKIIEASRPKYGMDELYPGELFYENHPGLKPLPMEGRAPFAPLIARDNVFLNPKTGKKEYQMSGNDYALPGFIAETYNTILTPGRVTQGDPNANIDELGVNMAVNLMGGGTLFGRVPKGALAMNAYHGSPHRFPPTAKNPLGEFDPMKVGTGEGAQAYGTGAAYLAEAPETAKSYAENLANRDISNQGRLNAHANAQRLFRLAGDAKYAADDIRYGLEVNPSDPQAQLLRDTLQHLESGTYAKPLENQGNFYKVDLPDDRIAMMLDYDKPFSNQSPDVQELIKNALEIRKKQTGGYGLFDPLEKSSIKDLIATIGEQRLQQAGIPGIRYLDQSSRDAGKGTSNFVVFDPADMTILERNGMTAQDVLAQEGKGLVPPVKRVAPQDEALRLAQERAALPVEQGGLGLPVDNTPEQRAMAMDFDTSAYHGTASDISAINPDYYGSSTGAKSAKDAFFSAESPETAVGYANYAAQNAPVSKLIEQANKYERLAQRGIEPDVNYAKYDDFLRQAEDLEKTISEERLRGQNVLPLLLNTKKSNIIDAEGNSFSDLEGKVNELIKKTKLQGKDAAIIKNLDDDAGFSNRPTTHYGMLNPDSVRSRFAAFDPFRRSAAIAAAMGVAAPDLMADEKQKPAKKNIVPPVKKQGK
jgi:hypothetical protein